MRLFKVLFAGIVVSMYFFPFEFRVFPGVNTKMAMAVLGLALFLVRRLAGNSYSVSREIAILFGIAFSVSLMSLLSITINQTPDKTYVTYVVSFLVWSSSAYFVCSVIKTVHGYVDVLLIVSYLAGVCVFQGVSAILIEFIPVVRDWVDAIFSLDQTLMHQIHRLYGIGALLDVAGSRFSVVLVAVAVCLGGAKIVLSPLKRVFYLVAFFIISVLGSMIARTTMVGMLLGLLFIAISFVFGRTHVHRPKNESLLSGAIIVGLLLVSVLVYNTGPDARKLFRFGFEGFFSLFEKGEWHVNSNDSLINNMIVFPETLHTWIIGDGYFENSKLDINYLGDATEKGYYMGTDIGYIRFIFYFGIIGLFCMMGVIVYSAFICVRNYSTERWIFILAMLTGLIVWLKVSTDVFLFFALFLAATALKDESPQAYRGDCRSPTTS